MVRLKIVTVVAKGTVRIPVKEDVEKTLFIQARILIRRIPFLVKVVSDPVSFITLIQFLYFRTVVLVIHVIFPVKKELYQLA